MSCEFCLQDKSFHVFSLYAPNRNPARDHFFEQVSSWVDPLVPTVLCGDFNTVFDRSLNRAGCDVSDTSRESSSSLSCLFDVCCIVDIWRYFHPSSSGFTWMNSDGSLSSRIEVIKAQAKCHLILFVKRFSHLGASTTFIGSGVPMGLFTVISKLESFLVSLVGCTGFRYCSSVCLVSLSHRWLRVFFTCFTCFLSSSSIPLV